MLTIVSVFVLIAVGSIVRVTGSGMGCPDWPTCFGRLVPPTSVTELPADYKTRWAVQGKEIADFDVVHTWTEYINRLLGVLIGLFIFATFLASLRHWSQDRRIPLASLAALLLVMFEGWLGAKVVEHDLRSILVTAHYGAALLVVFALIYAIVLSHQTLWMEETMRNKDAVLRRIYVFSALIVVQIALGTHVRGMVDDLAKAMNDVGRDSWLTTIGLPFYVHRSFSLLISVAFGMMMRTLYRSGGHNAKLVSWMIVLGILFSFEILSGVIMTYFGIPLAAQPLHLVVSSLILGISMMLVLRVRQARLV